MYLSYSGFWLVVVSRRGGVCVVWLFMRLFLACSFRLSVINWWHVFLSYVPMALTLAVVVLAIQLAPLMKGLDYAILAAKVSTALSQSLAMWPLVVTIAALMYLFLHFHSRPVYLLDFACFDPPKEWQVTHERECARKPVPPLLYIRIRYCPIVLKQRVQCCSCRPCILLCYRAASIN